MNALLALSLLAVPLCAQYKSVNPRVAVIVEQVAEARITETLRKLESFETRNLLSAQDQPTRGIGAARKWIFEQLQSYSPKLQVSYDQYRVKKIAGAASRVPNDVDLYNVIAELPGKVHPEQRILVTAHYDTIVFKPTGAGQTAVPEDPNSIQPGVTDDGSGTACVLELARIMSQYEFDKTLVFVAFSGEEQGLLGSTLYSAKAKKAGQKIEAVINNDIIGFKENATGRAESRRVNVFSDGALDSPSRTLARYIREIGERYVPFMRVEPVFRSDRVSRGGDHTPFALEGFAAARMTSPEENLSNEHAVSDTFANTSPAYVTRVTKINGAVAATLALAPMAPLVNESVQRDGRPVNNLLLTRGANNTDAVMRWKHADEADLAGFAIVVRATTAPYWEREVYVGNVTTYTMPDVSIDELVFGVIAIDKEGNESLVAPYVPAERAKTVIEVY